MGKATRWLKSLLGVGGGGGRRESKGSGGKDGPDGGDVGNKKRWSFAKPARTSNSVEVATGDGSRQWQRPYMSNSEKEQTRRAIAVAAATAAAADAAVAAAQAAAVVVRLTSQGRTAGAALAVADGREKSAAVKIQAAFRGYLARKALRALRALVKLQALVRGYLVRKQAAEDLQRMQSLFRAQSAVLSRKYQRATPTRDRTRVHPESRHHRRSLERVDETRSERAGSLHRRRLSSTLDPGVNSSDDSPKIVEVDPGRPKIRTRRLSINNNNNNNPSSSCESSAAEDSSCCYKSSPLLCHIPPRLSTTPSLKNCNPEWSSLYAGDEYRHATTAHNTPRFLNSSSSWAAVQGHHHHVPVTPTKSVCGADGFRRYQAHQLLSNHPGYMASTESFSAKLRSLSAPRQRPDVVASKKKIAALYEIMESRASLSGIRMQRSCSQAQEIVGFRTAERMAEFGREVEVDHYLQRRW